MAAHLHERYEDSKLYRIRHSTAHIMAQAVLEMFPDAKIAIGPAIEEGFYYDFDLPRTLTPEDLEQIQQRMAEIIKGNYPFVRKVISADEARQVFKDQPYKLELIDGLEKGEVDEDGNPLDGKAGDLALHARHLHRPVPRAARRDDARDQPAGGQADAGLRRLLARRRAQPHAAAHLRHGLEHAQRS